MKTEEPDIAVRVDSEENTVPAEREDATDQNQEQIEISSDEEERMEVDGALGGVSQDTGGGSGEQTVSPVVGESVNYRRSRC